jgi:hypothetical protein
VCIFLQQPLFSVRVKVIDALTDVLRRTARSEEEAEREDYSSPAVPVDPLLLENSESVDILSTNTSTITTTRSSNASATSTATSERTKIQQQLRPPACVANVSPLVTPHHNLPLRSAAGAAYQRIGINMLEAGGTTAEVVLKGCLSSLHKHALARKMRKAGPEYWDCTLCSYRNNLSGRNACVQCGTETKDILIEPRQHAIREAREDALLHHLIVLQSAAAREHQQQVTGSRTKGGNGGGNGASSSIITKFLSRKDVMRPLLSLWCDGNNQEEGEEEVFSGKNTLQSSLDSAKPHRNTIGMRAQSIIHSLLERCLSTYSYSQWKEEEKNATTTSTTTSSMGVNKLERKKMEKEDLSEKLIVHENRSGEEKEVKSIKETTTTTNIMNKVNTSGELNVMNVLFDAVSRLVQPTTSKDIVAGLRGVSLLSKLVHQDPSWAHAIQNHCIDAIETAVRVNVFKCFLCHNIFAENKLFFFVIILQVRVLKEREEMDESTPMECLKICKVEVMRALAALAAMGGASRPKVFYDGCTAKYVLYIFVVCYCFETSITLLDD